MMPLFDNRREAFCVLALICCIQHLVEAGVQCNSDIDCKSKLIIAGDSVCEDGFCTNPFQSGCLKTMENQYGKKKEFRIPGALDKIRICNSDDNSIKDETLKAAICRQPDYFSYDEVRIAPSNWDSAIINGWIYQILLTELLDVPATLENGDGMNGRGSFYDRKNDFVYVNSAYEKDIHTTLWKSDELDGDCSKTTEPCAHILPELWYGSVDPKFQTDGRILPSVSNGMIARLGYYIPMYTAQQHPELSTFYGLNSNQNREKVASTFKTPISYAQYCNIADCSVGNDVASRPPKDDSEGSKYFVDGSFKGHFIDPPESNCQLYQDNCTGHLVDPGCSWSTYGEAQMYWNNIPLESRGSNDNNNGYSSSQMRQILLAANATRNSVMIWWWHPDPLLIEFEDSDFSLQRIDWKRTSRKCLKWRQENIDYCSEDVNKRRGPGPLGSCDSPVERPTKLFSRSLKTMNDKKEKALRSPTLDFMSNFKIEPYALDDIMRDWVNIKIDYSGIDPRHATCKWVYDNIESFETFLPSDYPRITRDVENPLTTVAYVFASLGLFLLLIFAVVTFIFREKSAIKYAQVEFLFWMISGWFLVTIGSMTSAEGTSDALCVTAEWGVLLGYTLEIAPILIKVQAINHVTRESVRFRRIRVNTKKLKTYPIYFAVPVIIYLIVWTCVDMPKSTSAAIFDNSDNENVVNIDYACSSKLQIWVIIGYVWQVLLLLSASVLAFLSRDVVEEMNESQWIGFLTYSHLMFLIFRIVVRGLWSNGVILGSVASSSISMILSLDVIVGAVIYFGPKFFKILNANSSSHKLFKSGLAAAR